MILRQDEPPRYPAIPYASRAPAGSTSGLVLRPTADVRVLQKSKNPARRFSGGKIEGFERSAWKQLVGRPDQEADAETPLDGTRLGSGVWPGPMEFSVEISRAGRASGVGAATGLGKITQPSSTRTSSPARRCLPEPTPSSSMSRAPEDVRAN